MKRLTLPEAMTLCAELWDWLAENPDKGKNSWPRLGEIRRTYGYIESDCFACRYALQTAKETGLPVCSHCPMRSVWGKNKNCTYYKSPYHKWYMQLSTISTIRNAKKIADGARRVLAEYYAKRR